MASSSSSYFEGPGEGPGDGRGVRASGGPSSNPSANAPGSERIVLHSHLKDMAIDALELSTVRDQATVCTSLSYVLSSFDMQPEMAEILASMVTAAYSLALDCKDESLLYMAYSCFSDAQLARIISLARAA